MIKYGEPSFFFLGLGYIKEHLPDHDEGLHPVDSSSTSDEEDFFSDIRHTHTQEAIKQLDAYLTCAAYSAVCSLSLKLNTALPASAACERLFSAAGLIFRRAAISSHNFENQLHQFRLLKWLPVEYIVTVEPVLNSLKFE